MKNLDQALRIWYINRLEWNKNGSDQMKYKRIKQSKYSIILFNINIYIYIYIIFNIFILM